MNNLNPIRGEERRVVSTKLYRSEFANFVKLCEREGKTVHAKLREMVQREVAEKVATIGEEMIEVEE